mgnify:CR=1 FL=1
MENGVTHSVIGAMIALLGFTVTLRGMIEETGGYWIGILLFGAGSWMLAHGAYLRATSPREPARQDPS